MPSTGLGASATAVNETKMSILRALCSSGRQSKRGQHIVWKASKSTKEKKKIRQARVGRKCWGKGRHK